MFCDGIEFVLEIEIEFDDCCCCCGWCCGLEVGVKLEIVEMDEFDELSGEFRAGNDKFVGRDILPPFKIWA